MEDIEPMALVQTLKRCMRIKEVERVGWKERAGIRTPESVADHTFGTTMVGLILSDLLHLNALTLVKMMLLHDLCEAITGDIQPGEMDDLEKKRLETSALEDLFVNIPEPFKSDYLSSFSMFNEATSPEAMLARDLDKIEMVLQALIYEEKGTDPALLDEFWVTANSKIRTPFGKSLFRSISELRRSRPSS